MASFQIRLSDSEDARLRKLAADIGAESPTKWALEVLLTRADQLEKWLDEGNFIQLIDGRKIFPDQVVSRPKGK